MLSDPSILPKAFSNPYSIVITESISPEADGLCYRVEGLSSKENADLDIFGYGTLEECLVNYSPYHVWKTLYRNLKTQNQIAEADKVLSEIRSTRPPGIRQWTG